MNQGWISLHRQIKGHWIYDDKPYDRYHAWTDILLSVNHADAKVLFDGHLLPVKAGQMFTSLSKLSEKWGWNDRTKTRRFLELLQSDGMVILERNKNGTLLTVANWEKFQSRETQMKQPRNTDETPFNTNNNGNNENNEINKLPTATATARVREPLGIVFDAYMQRFGQVPSSTVQADLSYFAEQIDAEAIFYAFDFALGERKTSWSYIKAILRNYVRDGIRTTEQVRLRELDRESQRAQRAPPSQTGLKSYDDDVDDI